VPPGLLIALGTVNLCSLAVLRPTAPIAADALLPGDPARALALAQELHTKPKMANHAHGLWGYSGETEDGRELTIQSLGVGGPSAAMVLAQLGELGVRRAIQVGTCRAVDRELRLGEVVAVREAIGTDGVSRELGGEEELAPDPELGAAVSSAAERAGLRAIRVASTDLIGRLDGRPADEWSRRGALAVEMAAAALFAAAPRCGVAVASLMVVTDSEDGAIDDDSLAEASARMGRVALAALSGSAQRL
jgi:uridine phosphorylase